MSDSVPAGGEVELLVSTFPDAAVALRLARTLVDERLIACANLLPGISSVFRWEGEVRTVDEVVLLLKTVAERLPSLAARIADLHPYGVPEILHLSAGASAMYSGWVRQETIGNP